MKIYNVIGNLFISVLFAAPLISAMSEHSMTENEFKAAWQRTGNPKVDKIIQSYADVGSMNAMSEWWTSPLHWAALNGNINDVRVLINEGHISAEIRDRLGRTPLHWAGIGFSKRIVEILINEFHVQVNPRDETKFTPLNYVVSSLLPSVDIVEILLDHGADPRIADHRGFTPLYYARRKTHQALIKILEAAEAKCEAEQKQAHQRVVKEIVELRSDYDRWLAGLKQAAAEDAEQKQAVEIKFSKEQQAQEMAAMQAAEIVQTQQVQNDTVGGWYTTAPVHEDGYVVKGSTQEMKEVDSPLPEDVLKSFVMVEQSSSSM
jgi:hypothetical protein